MDFFKCCRSVETGHGYELLKRGSKNEKTSVFFSSLDDIPKKDLINRNSQVLRIEKSEYDQVVKQLKDNGQKWTDPFFPPNEDSLGDIPGITKTNKWKRLSDMLNKPALFDGRVQPKDVVQGGLDDCYFLSALAALAEKQEYIKTVFRNQVYNPNGIYKVALRIDGEITQILVDDYVPVNNNGEPLFSQPYKNQFWVLILEKAWAKIHGSYANIVSGNPCQIFKAVSYAPTQTFFIKGQQQNQKIWRNLLNKTIKKYPCCCSTIENDEIDWSSLGLIQNHSYTLMHAAEVRSKDRVFRVIQLRNPWNKVEWMGQSSENDRDFWDSIQKSEEKEYFVSNFNQEKDGIFFMTFHDFCKYFCQIHLCLAQESAHYLSQNFYCNKKNGSVYQFQVQKPGLYFFELHQSHIKLGYQRDEQDTCRSTILLAKINKSNDYQFVDGTLKYNDKDTMLKANLSQGKYILYAKLDPSRSKGQIPQKSIISSYSCNLITLQVANQKDFPNFLKKMFLNHAKLNKRQTYNNGLMWIAWKLLYQQGGYAYIAFGNSSESKKKFVITFDEEQFDKLHFKLKKSYKRKGNNQVLEVLPNQQEIILVRVKNQVFKGLKFPPQIGIKLEPLEGDGGSERH